MHSMTPEDLKHALHLQDPHGYRNLQKSAYHGWIGLRYDHTGALHFCTGIQDDGSAITDNPCASLKDGLEKVATYAAPSVAMNLTDALGFMGLTRGGLVP